MGVVSNNPLWRGQVGSCVENPGAKCKYLLSILSQLPLLRASRGYLNSELGRILFINIIGLILTGLILLLFTCCHV